MIPFLILAFIVGAAIGSFLNVVIYRIPKGESIVFPNSKCQNCQTTLRWWHNIPLVSWFLLRGKCYFCSEKISMQYPFIELIAGLIFVILYIKIGLVWQLPFVAASFYALLALTMIDFEYMAVPDSVNFTALVFALVQPDFINALFYAAIAAGGLYLIGKLSSFLAKKEAMGSADVIVAGTMGALLGFSETFLSSLFVFGPSSAMIPSLINRESGVPFVPFLALATFIIYLYDTQTTRLIGKLIYG